MTGGEQSVMRFCFGFPVVKVRSGIRMYPVIYLSTSSVLSWELPMAASDANDKLSSNSLPVVHTVISRACPVDFVDHLDIQPNNNPAFESYLLSLSIRISRL